MSGSCYQKYSCLHWNSTPFKMMVNILYLKSSNELPVPDHWSPHFTILSKWLSVCLASRAWHWWLLLQCHFSLSKFLVSKYTSPYWCGLSKLTLFSQLVSTRIRWRLWLMPFITYCLLRAFSHRVTIDIRVMIAERPHRVCYRTNCFEGTI